MIIASKYKITTTKYQINRSKCPNEWIKYSTVYVFINSQSFQRTMLMIGTIELFCWFN